MLRKIRITAALVLFILTTMLFLDFTGSLQMWFGWLAKIQLLPAVLALNIVAIIALAAGTLIFGRIYCSAVCPLGVFQDGVSHLAGNKNKFKFARAKTYLRYAVLAGFVVVLAVGVSSIISLLDPYAAYGRIASNLLAPLYELANNVLAYFAARANSYAFYSVDVWLKSLLALTVALITFAVITFLAWRNGRSYCNTFCPVGTLLGLLSKFSVFRPVFNKEKCKKCGVCESNCKSSCIDSKELTIDYSRCVACMNCVDKCNFDAIKYLPRQLLPKKKNQKIEYSKENVGNAKGISRRNFVSILAMFAFAGTLKAQQDAVDGGLAVITDKKIPQRAEKIVPPGAQSARNFKKHCTSCLLCVSECPNQVLHPSSKIANLMQPEMSYERGYCRPECTTCSQVCPTGAITRITAAQKASIKIGRAVWTKENCIVNTDNVNCTNCQRHCPTGAITLVARDSSIGALQIPVIDDERCIGCGACENLCPANPFSAIYVEGILMHRTV
jgi:polyferredoxin